MKSVLIVAAEASSNTYCQRMISLMRAQAQSKLHFFGVSDQKTASLQFEQIGKAEDMAVVGAVEVIKHYSELKDVFDRLLDKAKELKPEFALLMDYPDFNLRLAAELKTLGIPVYYFISPQVWAWRQKRIHQIKKVCNKVYLIFPFEVPFYEKHQVNHLFVGHPLLDEMPENAASMDAKAFKKSKYGLSSQDISFGLMPGSRKGELEKNFPSQLEAARLIMKKHPNVRLFILQAPTISKELLLSYLDNFKLPYVVLSGEPFAMIQTIDLMLVTSGTATLQVGLMEVPMVIMYRLNWLTGVIARLIVRGAKYFGLVNLILDRLVVPECFQNDAKPEALAEKIFKFIEKPEYFVSVKKDLGLIKSKLGERGACEKVVKDLCQQHPL